MDGRLALRRHLYEQLGAQPDRRVRRALRRQIRVVAGAPDQQRPDDGSAGVREPRRPRPSPGPTARER